MFALNCYCSVIINSGADLGGGFVVCGLERIFMKNDQDFMQEPSLHTFTQRVGQRTSLS